MQREDYERLMAEETSTKTKLFFAGVYLFSSRGYANVGIRELCRQVNVKESAFYNHYSGKEALFSRILSYFEEVSSRVVFSEEEINAAVDRGDVLCFFEENMRKFAGFTSSPLYFTVLQIVLTESYVNRQAGEIASKNLYHLRREYTERVLQGLMERGLIRPCSVETVTTSYYYGLKGMLDEYLLLDTWQKDLTALNERIRRHILFFAELLKP